MFSNILIWFVIVPVIMMIGLACCSNSNMKAIRGVMVAGSVVLLAMSIWLVVDFLGLRAAGDTSEMLYTGSWMWYAPLNIHLAVGVDGISVLMLLLSSIIVFAGTFASWKIDPLPKNFFLWFCLLSTGVFGFFISIDMFTMFMFYEVALIPMYLLIGVWGTGRKEYSAMKLTLMLMGGSAFLMLGLLGIYWHGTPEGGVHTWNILEISHNASIDPSWQNLLFCFTFVGFGVLGAMFPFHTWSPDGHACAPTAVSMLHAGVLMKLGGYGCFRIAIFLLPSAAQELAWIFIILTGISVVYGAFSACVQTDLKYINAYSSVSHCGMVLFAILMLNQTAMTGGILQMLSHGLMTALFFALIGMIYGRTHTRDIREMGGMMQIMPYLGVCYMIAGFASLGLPG
ncbi:MAG: NADH-quinone oxidoreductase subunit M, partial [Muribaculaceae bacterium]|nr:NADH-quinone oxidoreductase subunit M [Muribaculaceae bacterium]